MKTLNKVKMQLVECITIPEILEEGNFYYSEKYQVANHLCACGCGQQRPIPIKTGHWQITNKEKLTVTPSLHHRIECKSHYIITSGCANIVNIPIPKKDWDKNYGFQDSQPGE